ncbi:DUF6492 family protein [Teredinibacter purpureus]|uniref:DUF6492 family protein n=1 Tax=Teredinibacter purpureus TaxID=2731756 RepID=UPI0005F84946|nr:DUF6492 family protein [Teredinibacter purpureus]
MDIVTTIFDDEAEFRLLRLQAKSYTLVDPESVNTVFIIYNDKHFDVFTNKKLPVLVNDYPEAFRGKLEFVDSEVFGIDRLTPGWLSQQQIKLAVSTIVKSECYLVLDAKNHFIRKVTKGSFLSQEDAGKPYLYLGDSGSMISCYLNCLKYFKAENQFTDIKRMPVTITPFIFISKYVTLLLRKISLRSFRNLHLLASHIATHKGFSKKHWIAESLLLLFSRDGYDSCTEFYLYTAFLVSQKNLDDHFEIPVNISGFCVFSQNPEDHYWNSLDGKLIALEDTNIKVFGLHREVLRYLNDGYRNNLITLYSTFYDELIVEYIRKEILPLDVTK